MGQCCRWQLSLQSRESFISYCYFLSLSFSHLPCCLRPLSLPVPCPSALDHPFPRWFFAGSHCLQSSVYIVCMWYSLCLPYMWLSASLHPVLPVFLLWHVPPVINNLDFIHFTSQFVHLFSHSFSKISAPRRWVKSVLLTVVCLEPRPCLTHNKNLRRHSVWLVFTMLIRTPSSQLFTQTSCQGSWWGKAVIDQAIRILSAM